MEEEENDREGAREGGGVNTGGVVAGVLLYTITLPSCDCHCSCGSTPGLEKKV